ncbi:hypothetical protein ACP4OV_001405 [Aristida adscensionis]
MGSEKEIIRIQEEEDDDEFVLLVLPMLYLAAEKEERKNKRPCYTSALSGAEWIREMIEGHESCCRSELRMEPRLLVQFSDMIRERSLLCNSRGVQVEEKLGMLLFMLSRNASFKALSERFQHGSETIHRHIQAAMGAVVAVANDYIKLPSVETHNLHLDCIGAIDGTHVPVTVKDNEAAPYTNRKGTFSQNVMLACNFDLNIVYVSIVWEGSASDAAVLQSTMRSGFRVPRGKYYLVDAGYANTPSFLAPYRGCIMAGRAKWSLKYEKGLVDLLLDHNIARFRTNNGWSSEGWTSIVKEFNRKFPECNFSRSQIQEHESQLKKDYKILNGARKRSGGSFDTKLGMVGATDDVWDELIEENAKIAKFRNKRFPLFESLNMLYEGHIAEGRHHISSLNPTRSNARKRGSPASAMGRSGTRKRGSPASAMARNTSPGSALGRYERNTSCQFQKRTDPIIEEPENVLRAQSANCNTEHDALSNEEGDDYETVSPHMVDSEVPTRIAAEHEAYSEKPR